jgi:hypothetical protein
MDDYEPIPLDASTSVAAREKQIADRWREKLTVKYLTGGLAKRQLGPLQALLVHVEEESDVGVDYERCLRAHRSETDSLSVENCIQRCLAAHEPPLQCSLTRQCEGYEGKIVLLVHCEEIATAWSCTIL